MTLFLDCEFNGFGSNELISIALVSDQDSPEDPLYAVLSIPSDPKPWVAQNILPNLSQAPEGLPSLQARLLKYLHAHPGETVIADWPEDFIHLMNLLTLPGGRWHAIALTMRLLPGLEITSQRPHNALSDARALMEAFKRHNMGGGPNSRHV
jgi:hypothetical protein